MPIDPMSSPGSNETIRIGRTCDLEVRELLGNWDLLEVLKSEEEEVDLGFIGGVCEPGVDFLAHRDLLTWTETLLDTGDSVCTCHGEAKIWRFTIESTLCEKS